MEFKKLNLSTVFTFNYSEIEKWLNDSTKLSKNSQNLIRYLQAIFNEAKVEQLSQEEIELISQIKFSDITFNPVNKEYTAVMK